MRGQHLHGAYAVWFDCSELTGVVLGSEPLEFPGQNKKPPETGQKLTVEVQVASTAAEGMHSLRVLSDGGISGPAPFLVHASNPNHSPAPKKRLTEPGFTTKDAVTGCWEVCSAEIGRWEVKNGVFGTQHSRRQLRNRVFGPSWAAKWGEVCPRRARRSLAQGMRS